MDVRAEAEVDDMVSVGGMKRLDMVSGCRRGDEVVKCKEVGWWGM
jgi:hypothetical protein